jgi:uncharacterized protein with FMN-binding domain
MRARTVAAVVGTAGGLAMVLSFKTPGSASSSGQLAAAGGPPAIGGSPVHSDGPPSTVAPQAGQTSVSTVDPTTTPAAGSGSVKGAVVPTQFGDVQVEVTSSAGRITDVVALELPSDRRRSAEISRYAGPILHDEAIQTQNARIDVVSGATYTSEAYARSLQAALDGHA